MDVISLSTLSILPSSFSSLVPMLSIELLTMYPKAAIPEASPSIASSLPFMRCLRRGFVIRYGIIARSVKPLR